MEKSPDFDKRDRFILSKGHASACLYSVLARSGFFSPDELMTFRKFGSRLQGHPSTRYALEGIEASTGSLGQGLSMASGVALALKLDKNPAKVFVLTGDGEMQEGSVWEALMAISHRKLDNIVVIVDKNNLQIDGSCDDVKSLGNLDKKLEAFGFDVQTVDGHSEEALTKALLAAKASNKPSAIIANTVKGKGISFMENNAGWHGKAPNDEEYAVAMADLEKNRAAVSIGGRREIKMADIKKIATRESYGNALVEVGKENPNVVVLDADLAAATKTGVFKKAFPDRHIDCGIAECNMTGIAAGLATCGKIPFISSFAMFAAGRAFEQVRNSVGYPKLNVKSERPMQAYP